MSIATPFARAHAQQAPLPLAPLMSNARYSAHRFSANRSNRSHRAVGSNCCTRFRNRRPARTVNDKHRGNRCCRERGAANPQQPRGNADGRRGQKSSTTVRSGSKRPAIRSVRPAIRPVGPAIRPTIRTAVGSVRPARPARPTRTTGPIGPAPGPTG